MAMMQGKRAMMEMLRAEDVRYVIGNPGTSESAMMDALEDYPELKYILVTQEGAGVGIADGYSRAARRPAFLNLHVETGLANAISLLYNAREGGSPMVVTAGNKDIRERAVEHTDLAQMVAQFTKWSADATRPEQVPIFLRRAFVEARTPPFGPTFVGFSANAMDEEADIDPFPSPPAFDRVPPDPRAVEEATRILAGAERPLMIVSDRIAQSQAVEETVRVAEQLGCPVHTTIMHSECNFPFSHPQFRGPIRLAFPEAEPIVGDADAVLFVGRFASGFYMFSQPRLDYFSPHTKLIHIDPDPTQVGTTQRTAVGMVADPRAALAALSEALGAEMPQAAVQAAAARARACDAEKGRLREEWRARLKSRWDERPMPPERMAWELAQASPDDAIIADDAVTARDAVQNAFSFDHPDSWFGGRGSSLGWGMGGTLGIKLANPDRPVIGIIGDGGAMMTAQAMWTAAAYEIPVVYAICNNGMYRVLKLNMNLYKTLIEGEKTPASRYTGMDFGKPFDMAGIAEGMGMRGRRVEDPERIRPELEEALTSGKPALLDIVIDGSL